ncbi:phage integrase N-terminal SAM-like domain-containing protein [Colwellia psychrerythraea]|uniref:Site-specific recombinase, phage integrase family n=1 Tax=Colwellia psychrerythraea (strain 34H / ATCC BAA-681) TaxID=167879 RepID=Q482E5_COLP3|nr:phage integrase N-terminal SAM-like domain-containing protein [Colwellia psychrerythraea]AAZ27009.1 site-specific recombinase, phage integrase family [Colwellia psychrerythraea 34H]
MTQQRKAEEKWMPPRVYKTKVAYVFQPKSGGKIRLCGLDVAKSLVWMLYEKECASLDNFNSVASLFEKFFLSASFIDKAPRTQKDYLGYKKDLLIAFGKMDINKVEPKHVRMFMDKKAVKSGISQANRHKSALQSIFSWAYERGKIKVNPCVGVKKFTEKARDRYVTDVEYQALLNHACPVIYAAAEISYLCMARRGDVERLRKEQLIADGIYIKQGKTGKKQIKEWSPRLKKAISHANKVNPSISSMYVIHQFNGSGYGTNGFRDRWVSTMERARKSTGYLMDFTFHDLKAKGISDFEGNLEEKRNAAGHTTIKQTADYDRKTHIVPTVKSRN